MDTVEMITEAYTRVADGLKRIDLADAGVVVKAYRAGAIIRIDVKEEVEDDSRRTNQRTSGDG